MNYGTRAALLVIHKNKAIDCCLKLNKINKQTNKPKV